MRLPLLIVFLFSVARATDLQFGLFTISVSDSWTAQIFHIVDQLSEWDQYTHKAYSRWARTNLSLDAADRELLQKHAAMRRTRGWGNGFEQAFLVDGSIEAATTRAIEQNLLPENDARTEEAILRHFAPKLEKLREQQRRQVADFQSGLQAERQRLLPWFQKLERFTQTNTAVQAPVFLVMNPEQSSGGGGANGGRIVIEVPAPDPVGTLFHESLHILLRPHLDEIKAAAQNAGLSPQSLQEGIVYALSPGLTDDAMQTDRLAIQMTRYLIRGTPAAYAYVQSYMMASIIRPVLRASIEAGETFPVFLPKAIARWRSIAPR